MAEWIDEVIARAKELRAAGVLSIAVNNCSVTFAPLPPPPVDLGKPEPVTDTPEPLDALNDPASWPGGVVPGFKIERLPQPEEY